MVLAFLIIQLSLVTLASSQECGRIPVESGPDIHRSYAKYIVEGQPSKPHTRPWQVAIQMTHNHTEYSGALIAPQWVLTAAHCMSDGEEPSQIYVHAGAHALNEKSGPREQFATAEKFYPHPNFGKENFYSDDIALIKLSVPLTYNDFVQPICLSSGVQEMVAPGEQVIVDGWGDTAKKQEDGTVLGSGNPNPSSVLLEVAVTIPSDEECRSVMGAMIDETQMCAGDGNKDACQGDSGGPVVKKAPNGRWFQVGIVSWGDGCGVPTKYGVYNRAYKYCDFIEKTIGEKLCLPTIQ